MSKCVECGLCRTKCPVFRATMKETASPRAKGMLLNREMNEKLFFFCTLCGMHEQDCPYCADLQILKQREKLVKSGTILSRGKQICDNIKEHGHPFRNNPSE